MENPEIPLSKRIVGIALKGDAISIFSPEHWGVRHMMGIQGTYEPEPPPPPPPDGGQTGGASNVIPFRKKLNVRSTPAFANNAIPFRRAA